MVHLQREAPARMKTMVPEHVVHLVRPYGLPRSAGSNDSAAP
jgi:hypothetical protein